MKPRYEHLHRTVSRSSFSAAPRLEWHPFYPERDGWELVTVVPDGNQFQFFWRRPVEQNTAEVPT